MAIHLENMALFVEVARAGSFTRASESLGIPLSSLSRRIAEFEKTLGLALINRTTRKLQLTPAGKEYFAECEAIVAQASIAHERLLKRREDLDGTLRISLTPDFGALVFRPLLGEFAERYPKLRFDLVLTPDFVDLVGGNIDVAVRFGYPVDSRLTMRTLGHIRHGLYATPAYLARHGTPRAPAELGSHQCICIHHAGKPPTRNVSRAGEVVALQMHERFASNHMSMILNLARMDLGIGVVPEVIARDDVRTGRLVQVLPDWEFPDIPVVALTASRLLPAGVRAFVEFLVERTAEVL